jgi:hypothetical protein
MMRKGPSDRMAMLQRVNNLVARPGFARTAMVRVAELTRGAASARLPRNVQDTPRPPRGETKKVR